MKAFLFKTFTLAALGAFQAHRRFVAADYVNLVRVPTSKKPAKFDHGLEATLKSSCDSLKILSLMVQRAGPSTIHGWKTCSSDGNSKWGANECHLHSIKEAHYVSGWRLQQNALQDLISKGELHVFGERFFIDPRAYIINHPAIYSFKFLEEKEVYQLHFGDDRKLSPGSGSTEPDYVFEEEERKIKLFGNIYEAGRLQFNPGKEAIIIPHGPLTHLVQTILIDPRVSKNGLYEVDCSKLKTHLEASSGVYPGIVIYYGNNQRSRVINYRSFILKKTQKKCVVLLKESNPCVPGENSNLGVLNENSNLVVLGLSILRSFAVIIDAKDPKMKMIFELYP